MELPRWHLVSDCAKKGQPLKIKDATVLFCIVHNLNAVHRIIKLIFFIFF